MKTDFEEFVNLVVANWRNRKYGLGGTITVPRRKQGDLAEDYIVKKINALTPNYLSVKSKGSQTPADIFALARRKDYWHIMLIQVKSSVEQNNITKLDKKDIAEFDDLARVINETIKGSQYSAKYADKSILISAGYAAVWRIKKTNGFTHNLQKAEFYRLYCRNTTDSIVNNAEPIIESVHNL